MRVSGSSSLTYMRDLGLPALTRVSGSSSLTYQRDLGLPALTRVSASSSLTYMRDLGLPAHTCYSLSYVYCLIFLQLQTLLRMCLRAQKIVFASSYGMQGFVYLLATGFD